MADEGTMNLTPSIIYSAGLAAFIMVLSRFIKMYYNRGYAMLLSSISKTLSKSQQLNALKTELFGSMQKGQTIVEIGAGTGTNFSFYPADCSVICIEPKLEFEDYLNGYVKKNGEHLKDVRFVEGKAESMSQIVPANSVDYVVSTLVLCSVQDESKVAAEALKVLKPGGQYLFLEHVIADENHRKTRLYHSMVSHITRRLLDNCHWDGEPWLAIEKAGFSKVEWRREEMSKSAVYSPVHFLCIGKATK